MEFKSFSSIPRLEKVNMRITQKMHGTNSQVLIYCEDNIKKLLPGSRNRYLSIDDDNFGFAKFVYDNEEEFLGLPEGIHYGEWCGPGINSGEGLTERKWFLFSRPDRYEGIELPTHVGFVPCLYDGCLDSRMIDEMMEFLKKNGSCASPGFMRPEGIVIEVDGNRYKKMFEQEEVEWSRPAEKKEKTIHPDYTYLLQPLRLEKLLSRDESYLKNHPKSLPLIVKDYIVDLVKEEQITGTQEEMDFIRKDISRAVFNFIKEYINET